MSGRTEGTLRAPADEIDRIVIPTGFGITARVLGRRSVMFVRGVDAHPGTVTPCGLRTARTSDPIDIRRPSG